MARTSIHPPKTPVTKGSKGVAANTIPNICKMPGAPFTPVPLPNIGRSGDSPKGYSTSVFVNGQPVAVEGCSFGSMGDIAAKGTGGGILSANTCGPTKFIGPGTFDVRIEGKGVHLLGDPTFNNCGPSGGPPNAATMAGILQPAFVAKWEHLGIKDNLQLICDCLCECAAEKDKTENCLYHKLKAIEEGNEFDGNMHPQVPYDMKTNPPSPYMSLKEDQGFRGTRNWRILGSRRPDVVITNLPGQRPEGANIKAIVEVKLGKMDWGEGQERDYRKIAGAREKLVTMKERDCKCPDEEKEPRKEPVLVEKPERKKARGSSFKLSPVAALLGAVAAVAVAAALVAAAPVTATAAAAVALMAVTSGPSQPSGANDAI